MRRTSPLAAALFVAALATTAHADALPEDDTPPEVSLLDPKSDTVLAPGTTLLTVRVSAEDAETGVMKVVLFVDGERVKELEDEPWVFADIALTPGTHELYASAENNWGDTAESKKVKVVVSAGSTPEPAPAGSSGGDTKVDDAKTDDAKTDDAKTDDAKTEAAEDAPKAAEKTVGKGEETPDGKADAKDGCFASARPRSLAGSGVALLVAIFAGLMLRRRGGRG